MKRKILILFLLAVSSVVLFPTDTAAKPFETKGLTNAVKVETLNQRGRRVYVQRRSRRAYPSDYRNYGRYRRTQTRGYRRSRLVRRVYYRDGRRYVRYIRVFY